MGPYRGRSRALDPHIRSGSFLRGARSLVMHISDDRRRVMEAGPTPSCDVRNRWIGSCVDSSSNPIKERGFVWKYAVLDTGLGVSDDFIPGMYSGVSYYVPAGVFWNVGGSPFFKHFF